MSFDEYLSSPEFNIELEYWNKQLANVGEYVKFYNSTSNIYTTQKIHFTNALLNNFLKEKNISKFNFIASIFSLYLTRINQKKGCLLKTNISTNKNTLLKIDYHEKYSFNEYLKEFSEIYNEALAHTTLDIENYVEQELSFYSIYDLTTQNENRTNDSVLTLNLYDDYLELVYNSDLFTDIYIKHMLMNMESLINNVLEDSNQLCCDISILCDEEKSLIADFSKSDKVTVNDDKTLGLAVHENALDNPYGIAIDDGIKQLTYLELDQITNSIAYDLLNNHNISSGNPMALMISRSYHYPVLVIALNKIGVPVIPIDPDYPTKRINHMINIGRCQNMIISNEYENLHDLNINTILIDDLEFNNNDDVVDIVCSGDDLFAIMFTSGTTGLPKGVKFANKQISETSIAYNEIFNITDEDIIGCYASFSFVASYRMFYALYLGACARIFNDNERKDNLLLINALKEKPISQVSLPPSVGIPIFDNEDLNIKYMVLTGAKITEFMNNKSNTQLVNNYGLTEVPTVISKIIDAQEDIEDVSLGRPICNTWVYILDKNNNQLPVGVPGEICISSKYLSPGYVSNDDLTNERFIDNPYCDCEDNSRLFKTGDIGFYNFDGEIEFIGREDDQLSVRGFRVESGEILKIIKSFKEIKEVVLDVDYDNLVAYYTCDGDLDVDAIKNALSSSLPYYMIPSLFIELDEIPLNMNGKIDKSTLKKVFNSNFEVDIDDKVLSVVVGAFRDVLHRDSILIDDDFVALGGNSLSAMNLQLLLKEKLGAILFANEIVELSTPLHISNKIKFDSSVYSDLTVKYTFDDDVLLSESQLNVYLDESVKDMGTGYNNPFRVQFSENYSADEIKQAVHKLLEIYPILKARIISDKGKLYFNFDGNVEIKEGSLNDLESFVRPFEFDKSLSRFLIVESESILCLDCHHLIFDGTSINILLDSLIAVLNNDSSDSIKDDGFLRQLSFEESMTQDYMDKSKDFFNDMLADREEVYDLLPSPNHDNNSIEYINTFKFNKDVLDSFLQDHSITYNQFFSSVFGYTLSRFSGSSKVLFNLIESGRGHMDLSNSIGMFVKTLPVLMECTNNDVDSFLDYSSDLINSVMKYDLYPFRLLANEYDLSAGIMFQYAHDIFDRFNNDFLTAQSLRIDSLGDLSFFIYNRGDNSFEVRVLYSDKFSDDFIKNFVDTFKLILDDMINVDKLSEINYVSSKDLDLLDSYNETEHDLVYDDVLDAFNDNLVSNAGSNLVSFNDVSYSYGEGTFIADKLAKKLIDLGTEAQDYVSFIVERSELYILSVLGIMSMGGVYVPLDDTLPDEHIRFMINDTQYKVIVVSDKTYNRVNNLVDDDVVLLNISDILKEDIGSLSSLPVVYGDLACILYTSGTTGVPKGVKITRKSILNVSSFYVDKYNLTSSDVYGLFSAIGFDVSNFIIGAVLYSGACLSVIPEDIRLDMVKMNDYFIKHDVTHSFITTQIGKIFVENINHTSLKILLVAGEKLGQIDSPSDYELVDAYGPTEAFAFISSINNDCKLHESSIGLLNYNTKAYILDNELRQTSIGAVGELYIAGAQVARGYLNLDDETDRAFIDNPFTDDEDYNKLYRTGDMVRVLPDGSLGIVGRRDNQVKIRGNRVELSEVEFVIRSKDEIDDVTVQTTLNNGNKELVAYIVSSSDLTGNEFSDSICSYVHDRKPEYMVPSYVIKLDEIPLNVNGKVDKKALPEIDLDSLRAEYVAPTNETEKIIVEAFEKVFNQDKISIHDDFTRLGGDSLTAIRLLSYLDDYNISAADVLSLHTPYAIAKTIKEDQFNLNVYSLETGCPLNEPQLNVYLDIVTNNKIDSYIIHINMNISKKYSVDKLVDALNKMIEVHPILEMCVSDDFEVPYLIKGIKPQIIVKSDVDDDYVSEFITKPFDLKNSLSRFLIVENNNQYNLSAVFHHITFDAISKNVFKHDLLDILEGEDVDVDDSFLKVTAFNQQIKESGDYVKAEEFFETILVDSDDVGILLDSVECDGPNSININLDLDNNLFKKFIDEYNVSENIIFTSAFAYTLSRFVGNDKVLFNIMENGRDRFNNFNSIGMFVNTLPLLVNCKNQNISSFIEDMSDLVYDVMRYNYYPFRLLANKYNINSNILFQFIPEWINGEEDKSIEINENGLISNMDDLIADFAVEVIQNADDYLLSVTYSDKYSSAFVGRFVESYNLILNEMLCADKLSDITYISSEDLAILDNYNETEHDLIYDDVLDAFNDNLMRNPNNALVSFNDISYTYAEGAYIANELAKNLINLGVDSHDCVSFLVERSELYMFSVLGIMSMGGVYVPLDDNLPDERIRFMIDDTQPKVVVVSDETYNRVNNLVDDDVVLLNISDILKEDIGRLSTLPVVYGDLACILYTSGTTGVPKGVKITRKAILNLVTNYVDRYELNSDDIYGLYATIGFDAASQAICQNIYAGSCLAIVPDDIRLNMNEVNKYFISHGVTHTMLTTQIGEIFMKTVENKSLKVLTVGGEKLGEFKNPGDYCLVDAYGPTETFAFISSIKNSQKLDSSSVGLPNYNSKFYIMDNENRRVPVGAVGELCVAGWQVADGYLNREEETHNAFINNPFDDCCDYSVIYRSGDMARLLPDGSVGIVGHRGSQAKIRGNRVELLEVEAIIRELDYVEEVTVQTINNDGNNELVAYIVSSKKDVFDDVCRFIGKNKPDYMIPSFIVELDNIPLTVNGKVDKHALPKVNLDTLQREYVTPSTENERIIVEAFEKVFNQKIGIYDDFTHLGGDSLTAIKLLSHIDNQRITAADILTQRTPYEIARNINNAQFDLDIYALSEECPLTEPQLNVYLDIITNNKTESYLIILEMDISKEYSIQKIYNTLNIMMDIHPILGMCVSEKYEMPYLVKGEKAQILVKTDASESFINKFKKDPFNLQNSLCRFLITENDENYSLCAVFHHLIFDGLSKDVFGKNLQSVLDGEHIDVDDSFLKVSAYTQQISETEEFDKAHDFYNHMLADINEAGVLLDDINSDGNDIHSIYLNYNNTLFDEFLNENHINENVLFTSVFAYTLSRFTGSEKVLFNMIENGRDRFNNFDAIGMYANTLPLLVDCKNQEIYSFLNSMHDLIYGVMKYDYYPFRLLAKQYDLNVDIIFQYLPEWYKKNDYKNSTFDISNMDDMISQFSCEVIQIDDKYELRITHSDKYSKNMVNRFSQTYNLILSQIINAKSLDEINYTTLSDLKLLDSYNHTERELLYDDVLDVFSEHLSKYPNNKLISTDEKTYTYGEGAFIVNELVNRLKEFDIESGDCISFLVNRSEWYLFAALGILSMGCVYVPLDDDYPDERIEFIINDTSSKVVITTDDTYERAKILSGDIIVLNVSDILNKSIGSLTSLDINYNDLACILYTSGTTGIPKGVKITRLSILNASSVYVDKYEMSNEDVYGFYVSIGFDVGSLALWSTIYAGASLNIIPKSIKLDIDKLNEYFIKHKVTYSAITAQVAKLFIQNIKKTSLKVLSVGGEKLGEIESPDYHLIDEYGPTESFGFISSINNPDKIHQSSVGLINYNTKIYILDQEQRRVPPGAVGELYIAGNQIADGYLNREEETFKSFIDNPFEDRSKYNVMYKTGDMVRYLPDKSIAILGRRDRQVKIRGNRVELSEVEQIIRELEFVKDVTVQTIKNGTNNNLVAYVVLSEEITNIKDYVCTHVEENKPNYMVPSYVSILDEIPLNVNGKVDEKNLPPITIEKMEYEYPASFIEKTVANAFSEVLGINEPVSLNDEFDALGGDSISVMRLIVKLRESNLHISVKEVLDYQSVRKIAENVEYKLSTNEINQEPYEGFIDSTPEIRYFWDLNLKNPSYFNQSLYLEASQRIDKDILKNAMTAIVNHHDILRSKIKDGKLYVDKISNEEYFTIEYCNSNDYSGETERINREIDIFNGPMIKLAIFEDEAVDNLYIVIHHLIFDELSWKILLEDLNLAYMQLLNNDKITLPAKTSSFQDYASSINEYKYNEELLKQKPHWENTLTSLRNTEHTKITDTPREMKSSMLRFPKEKSLILLTNATKQYDCSINGLFLSVIVKSWRKITGENELSIRVEDHGREEFDENIVIERTVGWFRTCYPVILKSNSEDNSEIINDVEKILNDIPEKGFGYPVIMGIKTKEIPLLTFNYLGEMNAMKTGEMFITKYRPDLSSPVALENNHQCDISINGFSLNREMTFELSYNHDRFNQETMDKFAKEILKTLDEIVLSCDDDYSEDIHIFSNHPDKKNLFFIHSANFGSEFFYYFAQELKDDYSFSVIEPYNLNHKETPLISIEEFADKYIKIIKSIQPEGPYYIGGFCFGGSIAHEMARKLKKQGENVEKLIILDANNIESEELKKLVLEDQILHAREYQKGGILNPKKSTIANMVEHAKLMGGIWYNYKPKPYDGETIFFRATKKSQGRLNEIADNTYNYLSSNKSRGFESYYDKEHLKIIDVPVEHDNIFSAEGLEVIVPEVKKFIGDGDLK